MAKHYLQTNCNGKLLYMFGMRKKWHDKVGRAYCKSPSLSPKLCKICLLWTDKCRSETCSANDTSAALLLPAAKRTSLRACLACKVKTTCGLPHFSYNFGYMTIQAWQPHAETFQACNEVGQVAVDASGLVAPRSRLSVAIACKKQRRRTGTGRSAQRHCDMYRSRLNSRNFTNKAGALHIVPEDACCLQQRQNKHRCPCCHRSRCLAGFCSAICRLSLHAFSKLYFGASIGENRSFVLRCAEVQIGTIASPASLAAGISTASDLSESLRIVRRCQQGGGARQAAMKLVVASKDVAVPEGVKIEVKARKIRVKGPRGEWTHYQQTFNRILISSVFLRTPSQRQHYPLFVQTPYVSCTFRLST